jgi:hypothetical protein
MPPLTTDSTSKQFKFEREKSRPIVVNFQGGQVTSDAGLSLIAGIDRKLQIYPIHLENLGFRHRKTIGFNLDGV